MNVPLPDIPLISDDWTNRMAESSSLSHSKWRHAFGVLALASSAAVLLSACSGNTPDSSAPSDTTPGSAVDEELRGTLPQSIIDAGKITITASFDNPPVIYASEADASKPAGVAYDLSVALTGLFGVEPDWQNTQWPGQLPGLDAGTFDVAWGQATVTAEREESLYDMIPFYLAPLSVLVPKGNPNGITSFASMCGVTVGGSVGAIQEYYVGLANDAFCDDGNKIKYVSYSTSEEVALASGAIDAIIDTYPVNVGAAKAMGGVEAVKLSDADKFDSGLAGIVFTKTNPALANAFATGLQKLWDEGVYQQILNDNGVPDAILERDQLVVNYLTGTPAGEIKG